jgi:uncharacterized RmlC-like cupin family protein
MTTQPDYKFLVDSYREWVSGEGIPLAEGFAVDLRTLDVAPWSRLGARGAVVNVAGRGDFLDLWLIELPPGGEADPQHHLFEAVAYVISGSGSTVIETGAGAHSFEWGPKSMFALPLNARYQLFNASGLEPARIALTTAAPITMNLYRDPAFVFGVDFEFAERVQDLRNRLGGSGRSIHDRHEDLDHNMWETNFVPDLSAFAQLQSHERRGKASRSISFLMADGVMHAHMSEIPAGRYKKAHRHMGGTHIYPVTGEGYSLLWYEGDTERIRIDWCHGVVYSPPDNMYHQHFNLSDESARYFAVKLGNYRYPVTSRMNGQFSASTADIRERKTQIEYEDEDPAIFQLFRKELAATDVALRMEDAHPSHRP